MRRVAFYGGSFDPVHKGHLEIAKRLIGAFKLDEFVFIPAFHAPHKKQMKPTSPYDRYAMLALATSDFEKIKVSKIELENPKEPYTIQTLTRLKKQLPSAHIFFVMGADSWQEITTWRDWQQVLSLVSIIVVTRPGYNITFEHVTETIRDRIFDFRGQNKIDIEDPKQRIYITDAVYVDASATRIREMVKANDPSWQSFVPAIVADYIVKYGLYLE